MPELPGGIVTFLMTDIEGSTRLLEQVPEAMTKAQRRHDELAAEYICEQTGGQIIKRLGDGLFCVFADAATAVIAACGLMRAYYAEHWFLPTPLRVRMALHTGEAIPVDGDYTSLTVNRCDRLRAIAHGGQMLVSQATAGLVQNSLPMDLSLRLLGSHRLKDLILPEEVYQVCLSGLPAAFPALRSLNRFPNNLPVLMTAFIGREKEIARVKTLMERKRLVTIMGAGGCGKTRLGQQAAVEMSEAFEHGIWLVKLGDLSEGSAIVAKIAEALKIREEAGRPLDETVTEYLRPRNLLLLLDNCEHVAAECAAQVNHLLAACPGLKVLTTSREALELEGETLYRLPPMLLPASRTAENPAALMAEIAQSEAGQLFLERAQAKDPEFALTSENAGSIVSLLHQVEGLPYAIVLAASALDTMTVAEVAAQSLDALPERRTRDLLPHQERMRSMQDFSFLRLPEPEQELLGTLWVFAGGWTVDAARTVCAPEQKSGTDIRSLLAALVNRSLVEVETVGNSRRFRLLEVTRSYLAERMEGTPEADTLRKRHLRYYTELAEKEEANLRGPSLAETLVRLEREHDNFRAALGKAKGAAEQLRLAGALWRFWRLRSHLTEGRKWLAAASSAQSEVPFRILGRALCGAGTLALQQSDTATARKLLEESLAYGEMAGHLRGMAETLNSLGYLDQIQGEYAASLVHYEQALPLWERSGDEWGIAATYNNLGMVSHALGDITRAQERYEASLAIYEQLDDSVAIAILSGNLAAVAHIQGRYDVATTLYEEAIRRLLELGNRIDAATSLNNLGAVLFEQNDFVNAEARCREGLQIHSEADNRVGIVRALFNLSRVYAATGQADLSCMLLAQSEKIRSQWDYHLNERDRANLERLTVSLRSALGEDGFASRWAAGEKLSQHEAVARVLPLRPN